MKIEKSDLRKVQNFLLKKTGKAIFDYNMVEENDRILIAVSGGKDSLSMLDLMTRKQKSLNIRFSLFAVHVNFKNISDNPKYLEDIFVKYNIKYCIHDAVLPEKNDAKLSDCFWCSWNRRRIIFELAKKYNCRKVAFAHHMDDIVETFLMNIFFYGEISTMPPKLSMFEGEIHIIRPLVYVPEKVIAEYARLMNFPVRTCRCPYFEISRRKWTEELIKVIEKKCPQVKINLLRSMKRIKKEYLI